MKAKRKETEKVKRNKVIKNKHIRNTKEKKRIEKGIKAQKSKRRI